MSKEKLRGKTKGTYEGSIFLEGVIEIDILKEVWALTTDSAAAGALTLAKAADAALTHFALGFEVVVGGAALVSAITITLKRGTTVLWKTRLPVAAAIGTTKQVMFNMPLPCAKGEALTLESTAGGTAVVLTGNIIGLTKNL